MSAVTQTEGLVVQALNSPFVLQPLTIGEPQPDEVLVKIKASGLCHTDIAIQIGQFPTAFPQVAGHEGAGEIVSVGSEVKGLTPGDHVLCSFASCSSCLYCKSGHPAGCSSWVERNFVRQRHPQASSAASFKAADGSYVQGTFFGQSSFARHSLVQASSCVKVPKGTDIVQLAPLGCGLQTGAGAVLNVLRPEPSISPSNNSIVITGLGAVGMGALFAAVQSQVANIVVVDLSESRLALAKELGAHVAFNGREADLVERVKQATGGLGAKWGVECTGNTNVLRTAYHSLSNFGHLVICGTPGPGHAPPFDIHDMVLYSKTVSAVSEGDSNPPEFIPFLMKLYAEGKFPVDRISKTFPAEKFDEALAAMKDGSVIKPIILF